MVPTVQPEPVVVDECDHFSLVVVNGVAEYRIVAPSVQPTSPLGLFSLVKAVIPGAPMSRRVAAGQMLLALGKLRATVITIRNYNDAVTIEPGASIESDNIRRYALHQASDLFTVLGYQPPNSKATIAIPGLTELVESVERHFAETLAGHRAAIAMGNVEFDGLGEVFKPGCIVAGPSSLGAGVIVAYRVVLSWFEEKKTLFRLETCFKMRLECVVPFGRYYALIQFEEVYSGWTGSKVKTLSELGVAVPVVAGCDLDAKLIDRGAKCVKILTKETDDGTPSFLQYDASSFVVHGGASRRATAPSAGAGRIVIDSERGLMLGHYPAQGSDEVTLAIMNAATRYKRVMADPSFGKPDTPPPNVETMLLYSIPPTSMHALIWPSVVGFSIAVKAWGHVLIDALSPIKFNDLAFDQLVLAPQRKKLIKALVRFGGKSTASKFEDIVAGKSGGSVFLLHGPPGVGKTLTAEAISELLHRPLYYVTMGELGTTPEEMEMRLGAVLDLCSGWDALTIIDEADVFLEKRQSGGGGDVVRNAMVCVMLRLLEYHQGILFLTTNRVLEFDPAFESRVTVALRYDHLDPAAREQVWRNLVGKLSGIEVAQDIDYAKLAQQVLNGRQIKNAVRLALALAEDEKAALTQDLIEQTMAITSIGREEMVKNAYQL